MSKDYVSYRNFWYRISTLKCKLNFLCVQSWIFVSRNPKIGASWSLWHKLGEKSDLVSKLWHIVRSRHPDFESAQNVWHKKQKNLFFVSRVCVEAYCSFFLPRSSEGNLHAHAHSSLFHRYACILYAALWNPRLWGGGRGRWGRKFFMLFSTISANLSVFFSQTRIQSEKRNKALVWLVDNLMLGMLTPLLFG